MWPFKKKKKETIATINDPIFGQSIQVLNKHGSPFFVGRLVSVTYNKRNGTQKLELNAIDLISFLEEYGKKK